MNIDGRALAEQLNLQTRRRLAKLPFRPLLVDVLIGDDPASLSYVKIKQRTALECGMDFELCHLPATVATMDVTDAITALGKREAVCGLIVQLPLPDHLDQMSILNAIPPSIDVDVLNAQSAAKFYNQAGAAGELVMVPPTAGAIMHILDSLPENWDDKQFVVVGRGELVGKPVAHLLEARGYMVDVVHTQTTHPAELLIQADCIILGLGKPNFLKGSQIREGVTVIDAGTSESGGTITGDADYPSVAPKAQFITPVPGGVGPLTVAKLIENVVLVAEHSVLS